MASRGSATPAGCGVSGFLGFAIGRYSGRARSRRCPGPRGNRRGDRGGPDRRAGRVSQKGRGRRPGHHLPAPAGCRLRGLLPGCPQPSGDRRRHRARPAATSSSGCSMPCDSAIASGELGAFRGLRLEFPIRGRGYRPRPRRISAHRRRRPRRSSARSRHSRPPATRPANIRTSTWSSSSGAGESRRAELRVLGGLGEPARLTLAAAKRVIDLRIRPLPHIDQAA